MPLPVNLAELTLDSRAERAYKAWVLEEERTSTIHSNRWALAWHELSPERQEHFRNLARQEQPAPAYRSLLVDLVRSTFPRHD